MGSKLASQISSLKPKVLAYRQSPMSWVDFKQPILAMVFYVLMLLVHRWVPMSAAGMLACAGLCTAVLVVCGWPFFKSELNKRSLMWFMPLNAMLMTLVLGSMNVIPIAHCMWLAAFFWVQLMRTFLGRMKQSWSSWCGGMIKYAVIFSMVGWVVSLSFWAPMVLVCLGVVWLVWVDCQQLSSVTMSMPDFCTSLSMVMWVVWSLSTVAVVLPSWAASLGIHMMYHDLLIMLAAVHVGRYFSNRKKKEVYQATKIAHDRWVWHDGEWRAKSHLDISERDLLYVTPEMRFDHGLIVLHASDDAEKMNDGEEVVETDFNHIQPNERLLNGCVLARLAPNSARVIRANVKDTLNQNTIVGRWFVPVVFLAAFMFSAYQASAYGVAHAIQVFMTVLMGACPCVWFIISPLSKARVMSSLNNERFKCLNDHVLFPVPEHIVIDRTGCIVQKSDCGTSMCIDDRMISLIRQLVRQGHRLYVISGHQNEQRKLELKSLLPDVEVRMSQVFNSVAQMSITGSDPAAKNKERVDLAAENKQRVIEWLQAEGRLPNDEELMQAPINMKRHRVMMIGDGDNDLDALREADLGVALGGDFRVQRSADVAITHDYANELTSYLLHQGSCRSFIKSANQWLLTYEVLAVMYNMLMLASAGLGWVSPSSACLIMAAFSITLLTSIEGWVYRAAPCPNRRGLNVDKPVKSMKGFKGMPYQGGKLDDVIAENAGKPLIISSI